jgi:HEPN domain-containing protein
MQESSLHVARHWLNAARVDRDVAREIADRFPQVATFHAQQAAEKALKAVLVLRAGDAPRSHLIDSLLEALLSIQMEVPGEIISAARSLEKHYLPTRYPDALGGGDPAKAYSQGDAGAAINAGEQVLRWAEAQLNEVE